MAKGQDTRKRIIERAAAMFNQRGYEGTSMAELMEATGLEKGGIYRHFNSKEEIAVEAFDHAWETALEYRMRDLESMPNRVDRLKQFISNFVERLPSLPGGCPLLNTAVDCDDGNVALRERVRNALRGLQGTLTTVVQQGVDEGHIRADVDPESVATLIISSLEGSLMISRLNRDREPMRIVQAHLEHYLENQIRKTKRKVLR
jgi:TetR/AcrR family transcriptional repressor of nem operon